jgi:hypothetical protein
MAGPPHFAVLIDGENVCGDIADELFERTRGLGTASVRRVYGNFSNSQAKTWLAPMVRHGIVARQVCSGKNAADIALIIDAMELLHSGRFESFCIVSGDKGFAQLATRLREMNVGVYGFCPESAFDDVRGSFTDVLQFTPAEDQETAELLRAVRSKMVDGSAPLSALGQVIDRKKYKSGSLSKLFDANKRFVLDRKNQSVRIAR